MKWAARFLALVVAIGLLAPIVSNDVPILARIDGELEAPAVCDVFGLERPTPPDGGWKRWWIDIPSQSDDWGFMPLWPKGPGELTTQPLTSGPSWAHPLGVDDSGRDVLARMVHGTRTAVLVALGCALLAALVGVPAGLVAGLGGPAADFVVLRLLELFLCFPTLIAIMAIATVVDGSLFVVILVLAAVSWVPFARMVRGELLRLREEPFVITARGLGVRGFRLFRGHLLPALRGPITVTALFVASGAILIETTLTFLGVGVGPDSASWGELLQQGRAHAHTGAWHLWTFPGTALATTVLAIYWLGERRQRPTQDAS